MWVHACVCKTSQIINPWNFPWFIMCAFTSESLKEQSGAGKKRTTELAEQKSEKENTSHHSLMASHKGAMCFVHNFFSLIHSHSAALCFRCWLSLSTQNTHEKKRENANMLFKMSFWHTFSIRDKFKSSSGIRMSRMCERWEVSRSVNIYAFFFFPPPNSTERTMKPARGFFFKQMNVLACLVPLHWCFAESNRIQRLSHHHVLWSFGEDDREKIRQWA